MKNSLGLRALLTMIQYWVKKIKTNKNDQKLAECFPLCPSITEDFLDENVQTIMETR